MPVPDAAGAPVAVPTTLLAALRDPVTLSELNAALLDAICEVTGAPMAAVLRQEHDDRLRVEHDRGTGLPDLLVIGDVRAQLWRVLLGQASLRWDAPEDAPAPLADHAGWGSGLAVRMPSRTGPPRLLAVGQPLVGDPDALSRVEALATVAAPAAECLQLVHASARVRLLLQRVTDLASSLTAASDPEGLLSALAEGLSAIDVVEGAAVWHLTSDEPPALVAASSHGLEVGGLDAIALQRITGILTPGTEPAVAELLAEAGPLLDGRQLTLLPLSGRPRRVLGLVHARPLDADERGVFSTLVGAIGPALRQAEMAVERRSLVATFGRVLRPHAMPADVDIGVEHHPDVGTAETFGGDFYDWFSPAADRVLIALGDVSGKGITAAAASSMAVWSLRALGRQGTGPSLIAHLLDTAVAEELGEDRFVTLALLDVDTITWRARLVLAGHPAPLLLGPAEPPTGLRADRPLGVLPGGPAFTTHEVRLEPGQALVLFTDGIADAVQPGGGRLGPDRLAAMAEEAARSGDVTADAIAARLWAGVRGWAGGAPDDDCAVIVLRRPGAR